MTTTTTENRAALEPQPTHPPTNKHAALRSTASDIVLVAYIQWTLCMLKDWLVSRADPYPYARMSLVSSILALGLVAISILRSRRPAAQARVDPSKWLIWLTMIVGAAQVAMLVDLLMPLPPFSGSEDAWIGLGIGFGPSMARMAVPLSMVVTQQEGLTDLVALAMLLLAMCFASVIAIITIRRADGVVHLSDAIAPAILTALLASAVSVPQLLAPESMVGTALLVVSASRLAGEARGRVAKPALPRKKKVAARVLVAVVAAILGTVWIAINLHEARLQVASRIAAPDPPGFSHFGQISRPMQDALIATEDHDFYRHHGFDWEAMHRALRVDIRDAKVEQGGSTITQQLAKNLFLTPSRTAPRKIQEAFLTYELEQELTKQRILELYLNNVDYGLGRRGIGAAASGYFHESPSELDVPQAALLAGLLSKPPLTDNDLFALTIQRRTALYRMLTYFPDHYSAAQIRQADAIPIDRLIYPYKDAWDRGATDTIPAIWHGVAFFRFDDPDEPTAIADVSPYLKPSLARFLDQASKRYALVGLDHLGVYADRTMRQSATKISAHAFGQAIDISGFRFADGSQVLVADHDHPAVARRLAPLEALLKQDFPIVVDWRDDPLRHQTHFHCEVRGPRPTGERTAEPDTT